MCLWKTVIYASLPPVFSEAHNIRNFTSVFPRLESLKCEERNLSLLIWSLFNQNLVIFEVNFQVIFHKTASVDATLK